MHLKEWAFVVCRWVCSSRTSGQSHSMTNCEPPRYLVRLTIDDNCTILIEVSFARAQNERPCWMKENGLTSYGWGYWRRSIERGSSKQRSRRVECHTCCTNCHQLLLSFSMRFLHLLICLPCLEQRANTFGIGRSRSSPGQLRLATLGCLLLP